MATEPDKVDSGVLGTLVAVLSFGLLATALAITALVRTEEEVLAAERSGTNEAFAEMRGAQEADLNLPPAYMDQAKGIVRLPIDRAMQVVVRDLRRNPESATPAKAVPNGDGAPADAAEAGEKAPDQAGTDAPPTNGEAAGEKAPDQPAPKKAPGPAAPRPAAPKPGAPAAPKAPTPAAPAPAPAP